MSTLQFLFVLTVGAALAQPMIEYQHCNEKYECAQVTEDFNFVECFGNNVCACLNNSNFDGVASGADKCRCSEPKFLQWNATEPFCLNPGQCLPGRHEVCLPFTENYLFVECPIPDAVPGSVSRGTSVCTCRAGFQGLATLESKCRCDGTLTWTNNVPHCKHIGISTIPLDAAGENTISFRRTDGGLPWPITRSDNVGNLIDHGPHCVNIVRELKDKNSLSEMEEMHLNHCLGFLRLVNQYFQTHSTSASLVWMWIDDDLRTPSPIFFYPGQPHPITFGLYLQNGLNPELFRDFGLKAVTQFDLFDIVSGFHMGQVLLKAHRQQPLLAEEWSYISSWQSEMAVRFGALGISRYFGSECSALVVSLLA